MARRPLASPPRRAGFTLIELLVVIAIITTLLALSAGAYFRVRVAQEEGVTNVTISKLQSALDQQWKAAMDNASDSFKDNADVGSLNSFVRSMSVNNAGVIDTRRAKVIWTKFQLRLEFPQNFYEAVTWPTTVGLQPKSVYYREIVGQVLPATLYTQPPDPSNAANVNPVGPLTDDDCHKQSAALLYLALVQSRRGIAPINPVENVGASGVGTITIGGKDFKVFLDTWGNPIGFIRWPTGTDDTRDINNAPFWVQNTITGVTYRVDPQDPELTLTSTLGFTAAAKLQFQLLVHTLNYNTQALPNNDRLPANLTPVIFSAGRDKQWGVRPDFSYGAGGEDDNIYGYRIRGMGRR